jgi:hypothetical protein
MSPLKQTIVDLSNAYVFFCASIYLGMFWSLHFFWFPNYPSTLNLENYYDAIIPIMAVCLVIMLVSEWKSKLMWVPIAWIPGLFAPVIIQQAYIEDINDQFSAGVTDEATLQTLLTDWMYLNDLRWIILTVMWCITMYFFIAKSKGR